MGDTEMRCGYSAGVLKIMIILCIMMSISSGQSAPNFQSVSGEFARNWIEDFKKEDAKAVLPSEPNWTESNQSENNQTDLWSWGGAPRGSKIVGGELERDPYYLRPLLNLSGDWLGETYTDSETGLPMEVYTDPITGRKHYQFLNPNTGLAFFTYYTYVDEKTGRTLYVYIDPSTGKEFHATSPPYDLIRSLAAGMTDQTL
jgi:hypothetical protein